jgi:hypothetical protein
MFQAAQGALQAAGFTRREYSHAGLHATCANELTRRRTHYPAVHARDLMIVQARRHTADDRDSDVGAASRPCP